MRDLLQHPSWWYSSKKLTELVISTAEYYIYYKVELSDPRAPLPNEHVRFREYGSEFVVNSLIPLLTLKLTPDHLQEALAHISTPIHLHFLHNAYSQTLAVTAFTA